MSLKEFGIIHKKLNEQLIASIQCTIKKKEELKPIFEKLIQYCKEYISGPIFATYYWLTEEDMDVEVCVPVSQPIEIDEIKSSIFEGVDVLAFVYKDTPEKEQLKEYYKRIFNYLKERGLPIGETRREVYLNYNNPDENEIEYQVVIHNWNDLLVSNIERVLGEKKGQEFLQGMKIPTLDSTNDERVQWINTTLEKLDKMTNEDQNYNIISRCAHIFPKEHIMRLRSVYRAIKDQSNDSLQAIDSVLMKMTENQLWFPDPVRYREGKIIYSERCPSNPEAYKKASTDIEKKKAHCYCPIIINYFDKMPIHHSFCKCSAGWERQIWEGILSKPVKVDVLKSLLKGDGTCQFAIHIPSDI